MRFLNGSRTTYRGAFIYHNQILGNGRWVGRDSRTGSDSTSSGVSINRVYYYDLSVSGKTMSG